MVRDSSKAPAGLRILIVEDDAGYAESLALLLETSGHQVEVAPSGPRGIEAARQAKPDVVLLDIGLPGMSGYEVARQLKGEGGRKKPFIIAVTGYGEPSDRLECAEAGIDLHFVKPVDPEQLRGVVKRFKRAVGK
jgi:CheY-like chemotaxis protein